MAFVDVLDRLHRTTNRYEASFASKLLAILDPDMPVIDSIVLRNLNLRLPAYTSKDRVARMGQLHATLRSCFSDFLTTEAGRYLVERFCARYPNANISKVKMLGLVLWQTRPNNAFHRTARKRRSAPPARGR